MSTQEKISKLKTLIHEGWKELEVLKDSMELDLAKSLNGTRTAGVRTRKGLKLISQQTQMLKKQLLQLQKLFDESKNNQ